jgi:hypothetical protein
MWMGKAALPLFPSTSFTNQIIRFPSLPRGNL